MQAIVLISAAAVLALGFLWFLRTPPAKLARQLRTLAVIALAALAVFCLVRGAVSLALTFAALAAGLMWRADRLGRASSADNPTGQPDDRGRVSRVRTDYLDMELNLATGAVQGHVLKGVFMGRTIASMAPAELMSLWQECSLEAPQSAQIIAAYLDSIHPAWRDDMADQEAKAEVRPDSKMTTEEACDILGLLPGASAEEIRQAHRELMKKLHPDRGGSSYLAAKINEAKELLLQTRSGSG